MDALQIARRNILNPLGFDERQLQQALDGMLSRSRAIDLAELYFEITRSESWQLEDGIVKEGCHNIDQGVGARAVSAEKTGFAYSDEILPHALQQAAQAAQAIAKLGGEGKALNVTARRSDRALYSAQDPSDSLPADQKIELLGLLDAEARRADPRVKQVIASLTGSYRVMLVAASDGTFTADTRPLVRLNVSVVAEQGMRRETGSYGGGGRFDYAWFLEADRAKNFAREAVRQALLNLEAEEAPAGTMTVVLGPGWPGILLHEAIGHGLEGDFNRKGTSAFSGRIGERVASPLCTIVDDGTLAKRRGSLNVDDEGTLTQCTTLIENGILTAYLQDKQNAKLIGTRSTGNGRRESYHHRPMPRMTNTYMLAGPHEPAEIIASVEKGLYAVNFGGGQVDITSGKFVFSASEAYLIEAGKLTHAVKGATLIGNGPDVLQRVFMVGNDWQLDPGVGTCGKEGQQVPVGVGQPTLRIDGLTVGGTHTG
ncbi:MAG: metalloprotease TldD [Gammaproteobacteria bacterium]